jgi:hypothetical protein
MLLGRLGGSFIGRMISVGLVSLTALFGWSQYQQYVGGNKRATKIVNASNKEAKKRVRKVKNIRRNIKRNNAFKRLRKEYPDPD